MSRLSRFTLIAFAMLALTHCSSTDEPKTPPEDSSGDVASDVSFDADTLSDEGDAAPEVDSDTSSDTALDTSTDAASDADTSTCTMFLDGTYDWGDWTCGTTDIRAFAIGVGITSVDQTIVGDAGTINSNYSNPACSRTTEFVNVYPSCNTVTSTTSSTFTCSATCAAAQCTAGTQAVLTATYTLASAGNTITATRVLDAAILSEISLQQVAGCQAGDTEIGTWTKR